MLHNPSRPPCATQISGRRLAHFKKPAVHRAFLAADLIRGDVILHRPTVKQAAELAGVSTSYVTAALKADFYRRLSVLQGCEPLIRSKSKAKAKPETLGERLARATAGERTEAAREIGVSVAIRSAVDSASRPRSRSTATRSRKWRDPIRSCRHCGQIPNLFSDRVSGCGG
jgi:hypothetical protein